MKILYNPQLSAFDKDGNLMHEHDSNIRFMLNIAKFSKHEFVLADLFVGTSAWNNRLEWFSREAKQVLLHNKPDLIWENDPMKVFNWKIALYELKLSIPIVTYNHWIDSPAYPKQEAFSYAKRQQEGEELADCVMANSYSAFNQIQARSRVKSAWILPPIIDFEEYKTDLKENIIVYNHRINNLYYYKEAFAAFIDAVRNIKFKEHWRIVITNPSGKDVPLLPELNNATWEVVSLNKSDYIDLLSKTAIVACTFLPSSGGGWSISLAEGIMSGCAVLVPQHSGYKEMVPDFMWHEPEHLHELVNSAELREHNNKTAKKYYEENFNPVKLIKALDEWLKHV